MVTVVQLVRASDCGSECRGFESHRSPFFKSLTTLCCEGFFLSIYLLPLSLLAVRPLNRGAIRLRSLSAPGMPLSSCLGLVDAAVRVERLLLIGKCRSPTCPLAHVPQCPWLPITLCPASSSYAKRGKSSAWVGKGCPGADAFLEKTVGCCRNVHFLARGSACAHRIFRFLPSPFTCLCKTQ